MLTNRAPAFLKEFQRLSNLTPPHRSCTNNERAIRDRFSDGREHFREQLGSANR